MILKEDLEGVLLDIEYKKLELLAPKDAIDFMDKTGNSVKLLIEYIGKGAAILFVDGKILSVKWYSIASLIRLYKLGSLFVKMIEEFYSIWKKKENGNIQTKP